MRYIKISEVLVGPEVENSKWRAGYVDLEEFRVVNLRSAEEVKRLDTRNSYLLRFTTQSTPEERDFDSGIESVFAKNVHRLLREYTEDVQAIIMSTRQIGDHVAADMLADLESQYESRLPEISLNARSKISKIVFTE